VEKSPLNGRPKETHNGSQRPGDGRSIDPGFLPGAFLAEYPEQSVPESISVPEAPHMLTVCRASLTLVFPLAPSSDKFGEYLRQDSVHISAVQGLSRFRKRIADLNDSGDITRHAFVSLLPYFV
jgi:hypothetical protein